MTFKKILASVMAAVMCLSLSVTAFAAPGDESTTEAVTEEITSEEATSEENTSEEASTEESVSEEATSEEATSEEATSEEASTEEPDKDDVISLIIKLLGQIDFEEVKNTLNDINEALGLPRVEDFTDIPAYADALYQKLEEMGLGYGDIINGLMSSDLLDWLNNLIFGGGNSDSVTTTAVDSENNSDENDGGESTPDTGIAVGGTIAALAALSGSSALAFVLRKRNDEE